MRYFLDSLKDDVDKLKDIINHPMEINLTDDERDYIDNATTCHICEKDREQDDIYVADHCQVTGKFMGPAHKSCNMN